MENRKLIEEIDKQIEMVAYPTSEFMRGYKQALQDFKRFLLAQPTETK